MRDKHEFDAVIEEARSGGAWVTIPFSVPDVFGTKGRVKVSATFDGHSYRGSIAPMGGAHVLGMSKAIRGGNWEVDGGYGARHDRAGHRTSGC